MRAPTKLGVLIGAFIVSILLTVTGELALATRGGTDSAGGDISCDAKIQDIAHNIRTWVKAHGEQSGVQLDLSTSLHPVTHAPYTFSQYEEAMLSLLEKPVYSKCVSKGDKGYPVRVGDAPKICATYVDPTGIRMRCDRILFENLTADRKIQQIHHELVVNIPGLEKATGPISTYKISTQLSAFTDNVIERRLVVVPKNRKRSDNKCENETIQLYRDKLKIDPTLIAIRLKTIEDTLGNQYNETINYKITACDNFKVSELASETCSAYRCGEMTQTKSFLIIESIEGTIGTERQIINRLHITTFGNEEAPSNKPPEVRIEFQNQN